MRLPLARGSLGLLASLAVLAALGFQLHPALGWALTGFLVLSVGFFRDPERAGPPGPPGLVVAAADGTVHAIEEVFEEAYVAGPCLRIAVFVTPWDVHVNRSPLAGEVEYLAHRPGAFRPAWVDKSSELNERQDLGLRVGPHRVLCRQIAGLVTRRILCHPKVGDRLARGERYGSIQYGSRHELYLPLESAPLVEVGQQVYGGATPLAQLPEGNPRS